MNNHEHEQLDADPGRPGAEVRPDRPRIYVASLADYNAGRLHGRWIDADGIIDDIHREIAEMLEESEELTSEEYAIHDYDGFGPVRLGEYESLETVARIAEGIREHGLAFAHWVSYLGTDDRDGLEEFEDHYLGHWFSVSEYAEDLLNDLGAEQELERLSEPVRNYVRLDVDAFARDIEIEYYVSEDADGVHIFTPR